MSREFDSITKLRNGLLVPLYHWLPLAVQVLLGFDLIFSLLDFALANGMPLFCHARHVGKLEHVFNTPSHHRVHHARNAGYAFKNFGGMLIIWDRLFGTYADEIEPVKYGIPNLRPRRNLLSVYTAGLQLLRPSTKGKSQFNRR